MTKVVSLVISSTDQSSKKNTNTVTNLNPEATNAQIKQLAQKLIAFTTDTYVGASKVTKESVI